MTRWFADDKVARMVYNGNHKRSNASGLHESPNGWGYCFKCLCTLVHTVHFTKTRKCNAKALASICFPIVFPTDRMHTEGGDQGRKKF